MKTSFLVCLHCLVACAVLAIKGFDTPKNHDRNKRYAFSTNRLPLSPDYKSKFYDPGHHQGYQYKPNAYESANSLHYDVPSGFDQFVPDKSTEYTYGAGGIYIPKSSKAKSDYVIEEVEAKKETEAPPKVTASAQPVKEVKVLTGADTPAPVTMVPMYQPPTFLSVIRNVFFSPTFLMTIVAIPLFFLGLLVLPSLSDLFGSFSSSSLPEITTTFASRFARNLDGENFTFSADRVLDVINEYGARSMEDPRCFQRFLCQAAKSGIESRSSDSWSVHKAIQKIAKSVDDRLWDAMGLKHLFHSLVDGNCNLLACNGSPAYMAGNIPLVEKITLLGRKLLHSTEVTH